MFDLNSKSRTSLANSDLVGPIRHAPKPPTLALPLHSFLLKQVTKMKLQKLSLLTLIHISSLLLLVLADSTQPPFSCDTSDPRTKSYPFCKTTLPINQRVQDLISRLTLDEKISQLVNSAPPIPRLGIPGYEWWSEALHGVAFLASVSLQDLADTYQPPFQSCIQQGKASGIMCAYNRVNGVPNCADYNLLSKTARGQWGFNGYITSDCDAVSIMHEKQGYAKVPEDAVADVLKAGMDVNCGNYLKNYTKSAVKKRKLPMSEIDRALHNLFSVRMRLGLFNGNPTKQPFGNIGSDQVCSQEHQNLALEAARNGIVLLKNTDSLLPLSKTKTTSLAVIGPNANSAKTLVGNYAGPPCKSITPLQALQSYAKDTRYHPGGRLPVTWYPQSFIKVPMTDMRMRPEPSSGYPGRTYRFYQGPKVFEFGYGLSYSKYSYEFLPVTQNKVYLNHQSCNKMVENSNPVRYMPVSEIAKELCDKRKFPVKVGVQNHGEMAGTHPVLLFVRQAKVGNGRPMKQLVGFHSVNLNAGERVEIEFELSPCEHLSRANEDGLMVIEEGPHFLSIGDKESEITVFI
ncbi:hypothetical protein SCA6_009169 [Theobroma cacao]